MPQVVTSDCRNCSDALANATILVAQSNQILRLDQPCGGSYVFANGCVP
jgi:hypothetical protein